MLGENISQTAQFVQSGNADIGIIALSLALAPTMKDKGRYFEIPADDYPAIEQAAVVLKSSKKKELAKKFMAFLRQPETIDDHAAIRLRGSEVTTRQRRWSS